MSFREGRAIVWERVSGSAEWPAVEQAPLIDSEGRVLAGDLLADRDYPATNRSLRDGFAVRSADLPGRLKVAGEVRAGDTFPGTVEPGHAVEIFTGAPVPAGADQVVMIEHVTRTGGGIETEIPAAPGEFINPRGSEARQGQVVVHRGQRLDFAHIAQAATVGLTEVPVFRRPRVAILATGDEIVEVADSPRDNQVRNSNAQSLAVQVRRAGALPAILPVARDNREEIRMRIEQGLEHDLLLLSGGVSAGKYDLVESVLAGLGAEFYFDRVLIQPGQPLVFGRVHNRSGSSFFFGLPGNPASTMVTFEVFARLAIAALSGEQEPSMPILFARLTEDFRHRPGLTRFLPAWRHDGSVTPIPWQGSSDIPALSRANAFLLVPADRAEWRKGDWIDVWPK